ncbi:hypothetical protein [Streptomyces sp. NPDC019937]|uniref:hypothetical protein n=1 Tax=Streptomyces sp. NPDC019937 TaxID=3154787 RepID=UPI003411D43F
MSHPARRLVADAVSYAAEHGSTDLNTKHLLRAALQYERTTELRDRIGELCRRIETDGGTEPDDGRTTAASPTHRAARSTSATPSS